MKCIRKVMVVIIELLLLIMDKIQANNLSIVPSSPIMLPHFSELDKSRKGMHPKAELTLHSCLTQERRYCRKKRRLIGEIFRYGKCLYTAFTYCLKTYEDPISSPRISRCVADCLRKHKFPSIAETCLEECYQKHVK
jgi:hypothetical protein